MQVPLWVALLAVGYLGVKFVQPPTWLVAALLGGGVLLAASPVGPALTGALN